MNRTLKIEYSIAQEDPLLKKAPPNIDVQTTPADYAPTQEQIDALARRLMPEIKKFFADEQIQREFAEWQERQGLAKADQ